MAHLTVRKLDDRVKERLRARAKRHGRTLEAEARAILEKAANGGHSVKPAPNASAKQPLKNEKGFGTLMHERFKRVGLTKAEKRQFDKAIEEMWRRNPPRFVEFDK